MPGQVLRPADDAVELGVEVDDAPEHGDMSGQARRRRVHEENAPRLPGRPEQLLQDAEQIAHEEFDPLPARHPGTPNDVHPKDHEVAGILDADGEQFAVQLQIAAERFEGAPCSGFLSHDQAERTQVREAARRGKPQPEVFDLAFRG